MVRLLTFLLFTTLITSCAEKKKTTTGFKVTLGAAALSGSNANGGLVLWGVNTTNQDRFSKILTPGNYGNLELSLNNGNWHFGAIVWHKASGNTFNLSGDVKCAVSTNVAVQGADINVPMNLSNANCLDPFFGNNVNDPTPSNRFAFNNGVENIFAPIKFFSCGHLQLVDTNADGIAENFAGSPCNSASEDVAKMYNEGTQSEEKIETYFKISLLEYNKLGNAAHSIGPNTIETGCLGADNDYTNDYAWAMASTDTGENVVNIPWGAPNKGIATKLEFFTDATCAVKRLDSIYFDGLLQSIGSSVDKAVVKSGATGNNGYLFLAINDFGAGYTPFWSIMPSVKCFTGASLTSCLPYNNFTGKKYGGEIYPSGINSQNHPLQITASGIFSTCTATVTGTGITVASTGSDGLTPSKCNIAVNISNGASYSNPYTATANFETPGSGTSTLSNLTMPQGYQIKLKGPDNAIGCSGLGFVPGSISTIYNDVAPKIVNKTFDSGTQECEFFLLDIVPANSGTLNSWNTGQFPEIEVDWLIGHEVVEPNNPIYTEETFFFSSHSFDQNNENVRMSNNIKSKLFDLIGYGVGGAGQTEVHNQISNYPNYNDRPFNGTIMSTAEGLAPKEMGGLLGKKYKTCQALMDARGTSTSFSFIEDGSPISFRFEIKNGQKAKAPFFQSAGTFPLRIETYVDNIPEMVYETDCAATTNPIYYVEEFRDEVRDESGETILEKKSRKHYFKAQNRNINDAQYLTAVGEVEIESIELTERTRTDNSNALIEYSKTARVGKAHLYNAGGAAGPLIKFSGTSSYRQTRDLGSDYNHWWTTERFGGVVQAKVNGLASLMNDKMSDYITNNNSSFPLTAPRQGGCEFNGTPNLNLIGEKYCESQTAQLPEWVPASVITRHTSVGFVVGAGATGDVAISDLCTDLATFKSAGAACGSPLTGKQASNLLPTFLIGAFKYNGNIPIPLNHSFVSTGDQVDNSLLELNFFPNFNP